MLQGLACHTMAGMCENCAYLGFRSGDGDGVGVFTQRLLTPLSFSFTRLSLRLRAHTSWVCVAFVFGVLNRCFRTHRIYLVRIDLQLDCVSSCLLSDIVLAYVAIHPSRGPVL